MSMIYEFDDLGVWITDERGKRVGFAGNFEGKVFYQCTGHEIEIEMIELNVCNYDWKSHQHTWKRVKIHSGTALYDLIEDAVESEHAYQMRENWASHYPQAFEPDPDAFGPRAYELSRGIL